MLGRGGVQAVQPGDTLEVRVAQGQRGPQVTEVLSVDTSTGGRLRRGRRDRHRRRFPPGAAAIVRRSK